MIEPRDEELSRIYRDAEAPVPPQRVDDNILAASRRVAGARPRSERSEFARRWGVPAALAATVVVTTTLALIVFERQSGLDTVTSAVPGADQPSKSPRVEQKPVARAPGQRARAAVEQGNIKRRSAAVQVCRIEAVQQHGRDACEHEAGDQRGSDGRVEEGDRQHERREDRDRYDERAH